MPPPGGSKKKKGRAPKHQNSFAFRHNPKSKKTEKILSSPIVGVCRRCQDKIEWRKKYRKYKPRSQPGKCNLCFQKNVLAAYHTICTKCATSDKAIAAMEKREGGGGSTPSSSNTTPIDTTPASECESEEVAAKREAAAATCKNKASKRRTRVCAICANEPALSKYSAASGEDGAMIERIHELEDTLESGVHADGHKLTLREKKGVERKIEKLQLELKQLRKKNVEEEEEEEGGGHIEGGDGNNVEEDEGEENDDYDLDSIDSPCEEEDDPFLLATGGKALVGEDYQNMLLARERKM
mmetsp:Transcript_47588/g.101119  ORF Transcript_47588/g.101119 Transcript_47588/m.101119 type:complete len:297 (+) Transcript_47588:108-998(+)|eukprot:CAMPEP_0172530650 /NCGR_PEP_ID=MMETSP1067-20121228/4314_1 /TAXON_ID=265564 ORGANISM="Thalassiosira punctigera, Strain Tpunct2005C2" /NCGR_SAMPLE_ID=MMETSP1067 /ASSEMBLY_ACC=CAM_ASM_000444 /LENGTH=296 /DNA_ID=CAMNT_0013314895 /DNA_START=97 /DNA_END=987 /DNA_ORIENTATION=-